MSKIDNAEIAAPADLRIRPLRPTPVKPLPKPKFRNPIDDPITGHVRSSQKQFFQPPLESE